MGMPGNSKFDGSGIDASAKWAHDMNGNRAVINTYVYIRFGFWNYVPRRPYWRLKLGKLHGHEI